MTLIWKEPGRPQARLKQACGCSFCLGWKHKKRQPAVKKTSPTARPVPHLQELATRLSRGRGSTMVQSSGFRASWSGFKQHFSLPF